MARKKKAFDLQAFLAKNCENADSLKQPLKLVKTDAKGKKAPQLTFTVPGADACRAKSVDEITDAILTEGENISTKTPPRVISNHLVAGAVNYVMSPDMLVAAIEGFHTTPAEVEEPAEEVAPERENTIPSRDVEPASSTNGEAVEN